MKRYAPLLTVASVAALGLALLMVNVNGDPAPRQEVAAAAPVADPAPTTALAPGPAPEPVVEEPAVAPPAIAEIAYAGRSSGNEVTVAIAVKDGRAVAYVCDGKKIEAWLDGTLEGDQLSLQGADGAAVTGTVDEAKSLGSVSVAGKQWPYAAKGVQAPEGLYEGRSGVDEVAERIGWIVLDGTQVGVRNAGGNLGPAPRLDPEDLDGVTVDGVRFSVTAVTGDDQVVGR